MNMISYILPLFRGEVQAVTNEELVIMFQNGDDKQKCLEQLYCKNFGIITKICMKYSSVEDLADLRQEAYFGIARAAEMWKPEKEKSFMTYAAYWILSVIKRYIDECSGVVRIPSNKRDLISRYNRTMNQYRLRFGCDPSARELCGLLDIKPDQLSELKKAIKAVQIRSTSEIIGGDNDDLTLEDTLAAEGDPIEELIERVQHEELSECLWSCVDGLEDQRAGEVLRKRYKEGRTYKECGDDLGISTERARQIEAKALRELRKPRHTKRLTPYLTDYAASRWGLTGTGYTAFRRFGSVQERTLMKLEDLTGVSLYHGIALPID